MKKRKTIIVSILLVAILVSSVLLASCASTKAEAYFKEDTVYSIDKLEFLPHLSISPFLMVFLDKNGTFISFDTKGNCVIQLLFDSSFVDVANGLLGDLLQGVDREPIDDFADSYLNTFFPGFHLDNLAESLELAKAGIGLEFIGLEKGSEALTSLDEALRDGGKFPTELKLEKLGIKITHKYFLKDVYSETTDTTYHGVFLGKKRKNTNPYVGMTLDGDSLSIHIDFIKLDAQCTKIS